MLPYAGRTHSEILDAMESVLTDPEWDEIERSAEPIDGERAKIIASAVRAVGSGAAATIARAYDEGKAARRTIYFPGWHGVTELGY